MNTKSNHSFDPTLSSGLAKPAQRALANMGIQRLDQLSQFREVEISQLHGIGPDALNQLRYALKVNNLSFATEE